jgi:hypothetical protein
MTDIDSSATQNSDQNSEVIESTAESTAESSNWYILQRSAGHCDIVGSDELSLDPSAQSWGPYTSQGEAIAKRIGLIRSGKCQPI